MNEEKPKLRKHMRLLTMLGLLIAATAGTLSAQSGTVIMPAREVSVKEALEEVRKQTAYTLVVNYDNLPASRRLTLTSAEIGVARLLEESLAGTGFTYELVGERIVVVPATTPVDDGAGAHSATYISGEDTDGVSMVNFRVNSHELMADYMNNAKALDEISRTLTDRKVLALLDRIVVTASSSPDGNTAFNDRLAGMRADAMTDYLLRKYPYLDRNIIRTGSIGEDWTGLRKMVSDDPATPLHAEVLAVLDDTATDSNAKRAGLKKIGGGEAYRYIASKMLPHLRGAAAVTMLLKQESRVTDTVYVDVPVEVERIVKVEIPAAAAPELELDPLFAVKTNLLGDVLSLLNVEVEVPIGDRWSVAGEYVTPWWLWGKKQYAAEVISGTVEGRYWFGDRTVRPQMTGWFGGLYGGAGYYDVEVGDEGWQGEYLHAGISGGYTHLIGKSGNWRMEYSLGLGYLATKYRHYEPQQDFAGDWHLIRQDSGTRRWVGPTRAKVSLVYMINHGKRVK